MLVEVYEDYDAMSARGAQVVIDQISRKPDSVLGLATGSTPVGLYNLLIAAHKQQGLDLSKVKTFNLDEYVGLPPTHEQSYHYFMWEHLFREVNINPSNIYMPQGMVQDVTLFCDWYEEQIAGAGGLDLQLLGIGANGHLAFNEPGSSLGSRTRIKTLTADTVRNNARFFEAGEEVPKYAITMGIGTIMEAKKLLLIANGRGKASAIKATLEGPVTAMIPATIVQMHRHAHVIIDEEAASALEFKHHHGISEPR